MFVEDVGWKPFDGAIDETSLRTVGIAAVDSDLESHNTDSEL
jgi:hypothetical protein